MQLAPEGGGESFVVIKLSAQSFALHQIRVRALEGVYSRDMGRGNSREWEGGPRPPRAPAFTRSGRRG